MQHRRGDQQEQPKRGHQAEERRSLDEAAQAIAQPCFRLRAGRGQPGNPQAIDVRPRQPQDRRQYDYRHRHVEPHNDGTRRTNPTDDRDASRPQAEHRDHDRAPGEEDRATGCRSGLDRRLLSGETLRHRFPKAVDNEERIVDADADADHGCELRSERW